MELIIVLVLFTLIVASWLFLPGASDGVQPAHSEAVGGGSSPRTT